MKKLTTVFLSLLIFLLAASLAQGREVRVRLLHVNDLHGYAEPFKSRWAAEAQGGIAFLAGEAGRLRQGKPSLLLAAGDMIHGHNFANLFKGESVVAVMNAMVFDAMVVGNHEFDFGLKVLEERIAQARFPVLGANVAGVKGLKPYVVKKVDGVRVAVLGLLHPETLGGTHPPKLPGVTLMPVAATAARYLKVLRKRADLVVVLSHQGYARDRQLAEEVPGIEVIVGGHSHTRLTTPAMVAGTYIVQAWEHGKALGVLDLTLVGGKIVRAEGRLVEIKPVPGREDPAVQQIVAKYQRKLEAAFNEPVGETEVDLDGEHARERETNLGNLVADLVRAEAGAEIALINGGSLRGSIPKGPIRLKQVYTAMPFDNYLVALKLTGRQLRQALEHGVSACPDKAGRFPQVSGLRFTYRSAAPPGSRVREVRVGDRPLELAAEYAVATNDYLAAGGDGYRVFREALQGRPPGEGDPAAKLVYNRPGRGLREVVRHYLKTQKKVAPRVDGRIREGE